MTEDKIDINLFIITDEIKNIYNKILLVIVNDQMQRNLKFKIQKFEIKMNANFFVKLKSNDIENKK